MTGYFSEDTIIAIATSMAGDAGVGIIRISGGNAIKVAKSLCPRWRPRVPRVLERGEVRDPDSGEVMDDGLIVFFPCGGSFTGEEVVELQLHGGRFSLGRILRKAVDLGDCRLALPGEFSFRAVRNGRVTLTEASALSRLIHARSLFEAQVARKMASGRAPVLEGIQRDLLEMMSLLELSIDFSDQDIEVVSWQEIKQRLERVVSVVERAAASMQMVNHVSRGLRVVLAGRPNAGKSTLFNTLLSSDRAIVSSEPGTTRDVVSEELHVGPFRVRLSDTAGLREPGSTVESLGMDQTRREVLGADLVIRVIDSSDVLNGTRTDEFRDFCSLTSDASRIIVLNKCDLVKSEDEKKKIIEELRVEDQRDCVWVSGSLSIGLEQLVQRMEEKLRTSYAPAFDASVLLPGLQLEALNCCERVLKETIAMFDSPGGPAPELISALIRDALQKMSLVMGEITPDDVLNKIFSEFCIGK